MWIDTLRCMCGKRKKSLLSSLKRCDPSWPGCQWSIQEGSNGARGSEDSRGSWESTAGLNPQRFLAVSLCLLTLSYSIDFFINPLSKCFSLPHTDISPTPSPPPRSWFSCSTLWSDLIWVCPWTNTEIYCISLYLVVEILIYYFRELNIGHLGLLCLWLNKNYEGQFSVCSVYFFKVNLQKKKLKRTRFFTKPKLTSNKIIKEVLKTLFNYIIGLCLHEHEL